MLTQKALLQLSRARPLIPCFPPGKGRSWEVTGHGNTADIMVVTAAMTDWSSFFQTSPL